MSRPAIKIQRPSAVFAWDKEGEVHCISVGTAADTLAVYKRERDLDNYERVEWCRKIRHDRGRFTGVRPSQMTSVDYSKYDGDKGEALKKAEAKAEEEAAAAVIAGDPDPNPEEQKEESPAPLKPKKRAKQ